MTDLPHTAVSSNAAAVMNELRRDFQGQIRSDKLYRAIYASDASIYQMIPDGVLLPTCVEDVVAAVRTCAKRGVPITPRGAGTGLTGGAVNRGLQLDCSRHLNRIIEIDARQRFAIVEPGVVLDELNTAAQPYGLHFAPDVATSSRATLGGMIANNSCGAHSVIYGRTCDHVLGLRVVLSDGSLRWWGCSEDANDNPLGQRCEESLREVMRDYADDIRARYPNILRRNGGYALDRLRISDGRLNLETVICGSEGTLGIVVGAKLKLTPLPAVKGLVVIHFANLLEALAATPAALEHHPAAVELLDKLILDAARAGSKTSRQIDLIEGNPQAVLIIEVFDEDDDRLVSRLRGVADDLRAKGMGFAWSVVTDPKRQEDVWSVRKSGLGLLMSRPGQRQPYDFVDDTAVDPRRLRDYIARFMQVLGEEGVEEASYYAHASVGCLHVKPVLNLRRIADVQRMYRVANRISSLALEFGGVMTGEHGDGLVRSCWLEKMFGPMLMEAFRKVKTAFDPQGILNPGKVIDPLPMTENLRWRPMDAPESPSAHPSVSLSVLDFSRHGGMGGLAEMCSGVGQCRQKLVGTMCPSYMATGDEVHTTRARANALRMTLNDQTLLDGLADPALDEVMDLCLSCKACKTECPTGVDMAKLKAEWLHHRNRRMGAPLRSRFIAAAPRLAKLGSMLTPLSNWIAQSRPARRLAEMFLGFTAQVPPPIFARQTFRQWFARRIRLPVTGSKQQIAFFCDTWTNCFTPQVGIAAVRVLEAIGYEVLLPQTVCCGRPAISKGLLDEARRLSEKNAAILADIAERDMPIVGVEPSCILTLVDEFPELVRSDVSRHIAKCAMTLESFLAQEPNFTNMKRLVRPHQGTPVLYHAHCHQKAMVGSQDAMKLLTLIAPSSEINSGCCGMAGAFGHEVEHQEVARLVGEQRLFPAIRARPDASVAVSGFSCRHQIAHYTAARPRHVVEHLAEALP